MTNICLHMYIYIYCSSNVRGSGRWFPERGCILEHRIFRFAKMILRDRCSTSYDLASLFRGTRSTLNRWNGKIAKRIGTTRASALHSTFQFWRKSRRIALVLMLSTSKIEDASQNCCVFDAVTLSSSKTQEISQTCCVFDVATLSSSKTQEVSHNCCVFDVVTLSSSKAQEVSQTCCLLMLSNSKIQEVLQNSFVFKLADGQIDRQTGLWIDRQTDR